VAFGVGAAAYQAMVAEAGRAGRTALLDLVDLERGDALLDMHRVQPAGARGRRPAGPVCGLTTSTCPQR
jgi:hypothetical protein